MPEPLVSIKNLKKHFPITKGLFSRVAGHVRAVDGVSFDIQRGETLGLVGESGCGKTTTGRSILRLIEPTSGEVRFDGQDVVGMGSSQMRALRRRMQIIFQDPYSSLNPRMTVGGMLGEALKIHKLAEGPARQEKIDDLLETVGLRTDHAQRYPHEFSGGQRQRIGIARALAVNPDFIVADEPVSALDVSIQAQIVNLLQELQDRLSLTYLFVAHDLSVVKHIFDRVAVMYLGKIVESGSTKDVLSHPCHPYTRALIDAVPTLNRNKPPAILQGEVPSFSSMPAGCSFQNRCINRSDQCIKVPEISPSSDREVRCFHPLKK